MFVLHACAADWVSKYNNLWDHGGEVSSLPVAALSGLSTRQRRLHLQPVCARCRVSHKLLHLKRSCTVCLFEKEKKNQTDSRTCYRLCALGSDHCVYETELSLLADLWSFFLPESAQSEAELSSLSHATQCQILKSSSPCFMLNTHTLYMYI